MAALLCESVCESVAAVFCESVAALPCSWLLLFYLKTLGPKPYQPFLMHSTTASDRLCTELQAKVIAPAIVHNHVTRNVFFTCAWCRRPCPRLRALVRPSPGLGTTRHAKNRGAGSAEGRAHANAP